jgi:hypothetical protein
VFINNLEISLMKFELFRFLIVFLSNCDINLSSVKIDIFEAKLNKNEPLSNGTYWQFVIKTG